jgi:hypothetical protein
VFFSDINTSGGNIAWTKIFTFDNKIVISLFTVSQVHKNFLNVLSASKKAVKENLVESANLRPVGTTVSCCNVIGPKMGLAPTKYEKVNYPVLFRTKH